MNLVQFGRKGKYSLRTIAFLLSMAALIEIWPISATAFDKPLFGVSLHNAQNGRREYRPLKDLPFLKELGANAWRDDIYEPGPDQQIGESYSFARWSPRIYEMLKASSFVPLLILIERAPGGVYASLESPERRTAIAGLAQSVARALNDHPAIIEIGNEWNMRWKRPVNTLNSLLFKSTDDNYSPENYATWANEAINAIRTTGSTSTIVVGAIGDDDGWVWTKRALEAGMAKQADGVSVHLYNFCMQPQNRSADEVLARLVDFHRIVQEKSGRPDIPIYLTEFGWPSAKAPCGVPVERVAANVAQLVLSLKTYPWVAGAWFYELHDHGTDPADLEGNFGLIDNYGQAKPATCTYSSAIHLARNLTEASLMSPTPSTRWLVGRQVDGNPVWVIWSASDNGHAATFEIPKGSRIERMCAPAGVEPDLAIQMMPLVVYPPVGAEASYSRVVVK